jgi:two-component system, cell cycle response regulator
LATATPVLVAEDNDIMQSVLGAMLRWWGFNPVIAPDGRQAWHILQSADAPRLGIIDWLMPGMDGLELCRRVRSSGSGDYTYLLLLTVRDNSADVAAGLDAGADDYLTKPFNAQDLLARLRTGTRIVQFQEELHAARTELRNLRTADALTGVLNRASILDALDRELAAGRKVAVLLADIDRLRHINGSFGERAGDAVLTEYGRRLCAAAPQSVMVGRYTGSEFLILVPNCDAEQVSHCADRVREAAACQPFTFGAASFPVTCTVGAIGCRHADASSLIGAAEEALAVAKQESRDRLAETLVSRSTALARNVSGIPFPRQTS